MGRLMSDGLFMLAGSGSSRCASLGILRRGGRGLRVSRSRTLIAAAGPAPTGWTGHATHVTAAGGTALLTQVRLHHRSRLGILLAKDHDRQPFLQVGRCLSAMYRLKGHPLRVNHLVIQDVVLLGGF